MNIISAFIAGVIFSIGLVISGMTNPQNIIGFLDITGAWNPALILVLAAAVLVTGIGYRLVWQRQQPLFATDFSVPTNRIVDGHLLTGAAIFGIGWGLVGLCPGPALSSLISGNSSVLIFIAAMLMGMLLRQFGIGLFASKITPQQV